MAREIPWTRSFTAKLGAVLFLLLGTMVVVSTLNVARLAGMRSDANKQRLFGDGTTYAYKILADLWRISGQTDEARAITAARLRAAAAANAHRYEVLLNG